MVQANVNATQVKAAIEVIKAVADTIKELGEVPAGVLYGQLMGAMDLARFEQIIGILTRSGVVSKKGDLLVWKAE